MSTLATLFAAQAPQARKTTLCEEGREGQPSPLGRSLSLKVGSPLTLLANFSTTSILGYQLYHLVGELLPAELGVRTGLMGPDGERSVEEEDAGASERDE